jgi:uncharacterized repeat protein (TIGR01451 family)
MKPSALNLPLFLLLFAPLCAVAAGTTAVAPNGVMLPVPLPDCHPGGIVSRQLIEGCDTVEDLDVTLAIDHQWTGDLLVTLESPAGTLVTLVDRPGYDGSGYGCGFAGLSVLLDDEALLAVEEQCADDSGGTIPAISGILAPNEPLSSFDGELGSGVWTLRVSDWAEEHTGKLVNWRLHFDCSSRDVDLRPELFADPARAMPGDTVILTLRLANVGSDPASGVEVIFELPEGLECQWAEPGALAEGDRITQRHGTLAPGERTEAQIALTVTTGRRESLKVLAQATAEQTDSAPWNDQVSAEIHVGLGSNRPAVIEGP